jgi:hypothetical protein
MPIQIKLSGIYKIEIGDYYYIGMSVSIFSRFQSHYNQLILNKHSSTKLQEKFNELGIEKLNFIVLERVSLTEYKNISKLKGKSLEVGFRRLLLNKEKDWMSRHSINFCLNKNNNNFS